MTKIGLGLLGILLISILIVAHLKYSSQEAAAENTRFHVVQRKSIHKSVQVSGLVQPLSAVDVKSRVSSKVGNVYVDEGDLVQFGDPLVELEAETIKAEIVELESALREAELSLEIAREALSSHQVELKRLAFERRKQLFAAGLLAKEEVDVAEFEYKEAVREFAKGEKNIELGEARVMTARAALERLRGDLKHTLITSPLSGVVLESHVEIGSSVSSISDSAQGGTTLMVIGSIEKQVLIGKVGASDVAQLKTGQAAQVSVDSLSGRTFRGELQRISPRGEQNRDGITEFQIEIALDPLPVGSFTNIPAVAEVITASAEDALALPESFLRFERETPYVWVDSSSGREKRYVQVGVRNGIDAEILSGVLAGEKVTAAEE